MVVLLTWAHSANPDWANSCVCSWSAGRLAGNSLVTFLPWVHHIFPAAQPRHVLMVQERKQAFFKTSAYIIKFATFPFSKVSILDKLKFHETDTTKGHRYREAWNSILHRLGGLGERIDTRNAKKTVRRKFPISCDLKTSQ